MIAEVALNIPLRRTFDYRLADGQTGRIVPGSRVVVPFGSRVRSGIVVGLKPLSDVPEQRLKTVQRATDAVPLLPEELLSFTRWVADYYLCGWGEVLEAALPSGLGVRFRAEYRWREGPPDAALLAGLSATAATAIGLLDGWDAARWSRVSDGDGDERWLVRQLRPEGAVNVRYVYAGTKSKPRTERWVVPNVHSTNDADMPAVGRRNAKRETRKERILRTLREEGAVPMVRLRALMSDPSAVVRQLADAGVVRVEERRVARRPGAAMPQPEAFLTLNAEQERASTAIRNALDANTYQGFLLQGVTGSGKTEVYLHAVREARAQGKSCLILVPEIALTAAMVNRFRSRFGEDVAVLHSGMGDGERFDEWSRVREGTARIVIGARSAVFAPLADLGLVIVDEEHDGSYKQDEAPRYHGRDAALMRAARNDAVAVLGSATPSLESVRNASVGKLGRLDLPERVQARALPPVEMLDLRTTPRFKGCALFTHPLVSALRETLERKEQAILFLNRRGFASLARCGTCGEVLLCTQCSISLTYHRSDDRLLCHRCDYTQPLPKVCPACQAETLSIVGIGTERVEQDVSLVFPEARVLRMDSDTLRRRGELERMMDAIRERRYDIIIGTQVLSKGHDFPHITLVAAVFADVSLNVADFRAPERTFQILTQMAGRAGRGERPGRVLIQTYNPSHYSLVHVRSHDTEAFTEEEAAIREQAGSPPYASYTLLWISAPDDRGAERLAGRVAHRLREVSGRRTDTPRILGPAEAPIKRLAGRYRWMILLQAPTIGPIHRLLLSVLDDPALKVAAQERIAVDVDPYSLL